MEALFTGGYGDVFSVESWLSDEERAGLTRLHWATRASKGCQALFEAASGPGRPFPNLQGHTVHWDDFSHIQCFFHKQHIWTEVGVAVPDFVTDWSIFRFFPTTIPGQGRTFSGSSFLRHTLAEVKRRLPRDFHVVVPCTPENNARHRLIRDFDGYDWEATLRRLDRLKVKGVVLNGGSDPVPEDRRLVDLTGKTSWAESIEILKRAKGFTGIDSALSILAAQIFTGDQLMVRANNPHLYTWKKTYYGPRDSYDFLVRKIESGL